MTTHNLPKTVGHHFSDILICKQKAWLHYHGNNSQKLPPPAHLRARQVEGQQIEEMVYQKRYPTGIKIPGYLEAKPAERLAATRSAMQQGAKVILQGYIVTDLGEGTLDVMECVGHDPQTSMGYAYRVGEIKRSKMLKTAHILQVSWYTDLLRQAYGQQVHEGFFILGGEVDQILVEDLTKYQSDYEAQKTALFHLRNQVVDPGPHLIPACLTCDWRGVCMPRLIHEKHLSLAPAVNQTHALALKELRLETWEDLLVASDETLLDVGLGDLELEVLRQGVDRLSKGMPPMRSLLRKNLFDNSIVVGLEFADLSGQRRGEGPLKPAAVHFESHSGVQSIPVQYDMNGTEHIDLAPLLNGHKLIFYGGTDIGPFVNLFKLQGERKRPEMVDLIEFIEKYVHSPLIGLELDTLIAYITENHVRLRGRERVPAIRKVLDWIRNSL